MVTCKLQESTRFKLFNHKKFVESFGIELFIQNEIILPRACENSQYIDPENGHNLFGDQRIVHNNKLRKLTNKGPKYR